MRLRYSAFRAGRLDIDWLLRSTLEADALMEAVEILRLVEEDRLYGGEVETVTLGGTVSVRDTFGNDTEG